MDPSTLDADRAYLAAQTVLCVEDDDEARELLGRFLRRRVGDVIEATSGEEGLSAFRQRRPRIVVTDVQMGPMDGLTMASEIRAVDPRALVVVITAFEQVDFLQRAIDAGVERYLTKPIRPERLEDALLSCARRLRAEELLAAEHHREIEQRQTHEWQALGLLASGMAHDFNNLLQGIMTNLDLAIEGGPAHPRRAELEAAMACAMQAKTLGQRLGTLSMSGVARLRRAPLAPVVRAGVERALADGRVAVRVDVPADVEVELDAEPLAQAFAQIARNAREARKDSGTFVVTAAREGDEIAVSFADTGPGIPAEAAPNLFDPYFTTKQRGSVRGMGLGLALCAAIVRRHKGRVSVTSSPAGATFVVSLPLARP